MRRAARAAPRAGPGRPPPDYGSNGFWDERYRSVPEPWEWLEHYWDVSDVIEAATGGDRECQVLHAGCGTSLLAEHMYDAGYRHIVNFDISPAAIEVMAARNLGRPWMRWLVMDATSMDLADGCFDLVLDKTLLDTFACADAFDQLSAAYLREAVRVLRPGGAFLCVSFNARDARLRELAAQLRLSVRKRARTSWGSKLFFVYVCRKGAEGAPPPSWREDGDGQEDEAEEGAAGGGGKDEAEEGCAEGGAEGGAPGAAAHPGLPKGAAGLAAFLCLDPEGNGAEVWGGRGARVGEVLDRAAKLLKGTFEAVDREPAFLAQHVNYEHRQLRLNRGDAVPPELFFTRAYGEGEELAVTWVRVTGVRFGARNRLLKARIQRVRRLVDDLNAGFEDPEYRRGLEGVQDRSALEAMIREVQVRVMAKHGFPVEGAAPRKVLDLVMEMKGFNGSAMFAVEVAQAVARTFVLSGYPKVAHGSGHGHYARDSRH